MMPPPTPARANLCIALLALIPAACALIFILHHGVDVPVFDQLYFAERVIHAHDRGHLAWEDVWSPHNESRMVIPAVALWLEVHTIGWHPRVEMLLSWLLAGATTAMLGLLARQTLPPRPAACTTALAGLCCFSLAQYANFLFGFQWPLFVPMLALAGGLLALGGRGAYGVRVAIAAAAALVATYAFANGMVLWGLLGAGVLLAPRAGRVERLAAAVAWAALAALALTAYFHGLDAVRDSPFDHVRDTLKFIALFIANGLRLYGEAPDALNTSAYIGAVAILAAAGAAAWAGVAAGLRRDVGLARAATPWVAIAGYAVASGLAASTGRLRFGMIAALSERYPTFALPLFVAIVPLLWLACARVPRLSPGRVAGAAGAILCASVLLGAVANRDAALVNWGTARAGSRAMAMMINVAPNPLRTPRFLYQDHAEGVRLINALDRCGMLGGLGGPLVRTRVAEEMLAPGAGPIPLAPYAAPARHVGPVTRGGAVELAWRQGERFIAVGWACNPAHPRAVADAVIVARLGADGRSTFIACTPETSWDRPEVTRTRTAITHRDFYLECPEAQVQAGTVVTFWAFDADSQRVGAISPPILIP